ncbi:MAG: SBBP repeat-containing protein [Fimbriimonadales bacterium]
MKSNRIGSLVFLVVCFASGQAQLTQTWQVPYNGTANGLDRAYAVAVDKRGNTYVTGQSDELITGTNYVTIKYGPAGNQVWKRSYDGAV